MANGDSAQSGLITTLIGDKLIWVVSN